MLTGTLMSGPVYAQFLPDRTGPPALYQRVLADPANVDENIRYAREARNRGDYEAAISVYERLLLFNPAVVELNYELGVLYFELESYTAARAYFETALKSLATRPDLQNAIRGYLTEIDRRLSPTRVYSFVNFGIRGW
jgi:tetratricopeptide (TPR) repeat protein